MESTTIPRSMAVSDFINTPPLDILRHIATCTLRERFVYRPLKKCGAGWIQRFRAHDEPEYAHQRGNEISDKVLALSKVRILASSSISMGNTSDLLLILVVDDEPIIIMFAVSVMNEAGHKTLEAHNALEALALIESRSDIGIVFADVVMPGEMNGISLARAIHKRWPSIGLIVTSGTYLAKDVELPQGGKFLIKPYGKNELLEALHVN